jgi:predicted HicB family RNase H-like nuclease
VDTQREEGQLEINLSKKEILELALQAHSSCMSLNEYVSKILLSYIGRGTDSESQQQETY